MDEILNLAKELLDKEEETQAIEKGKRFIPIITNLADVEPEEVIFLWEPYLPIGKLTFLEGDPGLGKTFLALCICAAVSNNTLLPDQEGKPTQAIKQGNVLFMTQEDGLADTLVPRLEMMGADRSKIRSFDGLRDTETGTVKPFTLEYVDELRQTLQKEKPILVVIDPLQAYLGSGVDMHRANETRPILSSLAKLAEEFQCAILIIRHLSKGSNKALYRGLGSIDFTAAARSILLVGQEPNTKQKVMAHIKSSCAITGISLAFELDLAHGFLWSGKSDFSPEELLAPPGLNDEERTSGKSNLDEAKEFLYDLLGEGAMQCNRIKQEAKDAAIAWRTVERAKEKIGFSAFKQGQEWYWPILHRPESTPSKNTDGGLGGLSSSLTAMGITGTAPTPSNDKPDGLKFEWSDIGTELKDHSYLRKPNLYNL